MAHMLDVRKLSPDAILAAASLLRVMLIMVAEVQDMLSEVPYTDIDYRVFTEAAESVALGESPFAGRTPLLQADATRYRYTPLLAYMLLPNVWLHRAWGKVLFSVLDLACAAILRRWLETFVTAGDLDTVKVGLSIWLFNPFCFTISTRGSGESFNILLLYACFFLLHVKQRALPAAMLFGLAVHWRLYPVVYALPIALSLADPEQTGIRRLVHCRSVMFGFVSVSVFVALALLFVLLYGPESFDAAYLHHGRRLDPQHNFSVYFYPTALHLEDPSGWFPNLAKYAALPQLACCAWLGWIEGPQRGHMVAPLLQTLALVATNKVLTAQYFVWWWAMVPIALPWLAWRRWPFWRAVLLWAAAEVHWLLWAYFLEFRRWLVRPAVWGASCVFFAAHIHLLQEVRRCARALPAEQTAAATTGEHTVKAE